MTAWTPGCHRPRLRKSHEHNFKTKLKLNPPFGASITLERVLPTEYTILLIWRTVTIDRLIPLFINGGEEAYPCFYGDSQVSTGCFGTAKAAGTCSNPEVTVSDWLKECYSQL